MADIDSCNIETLKSLAAMMGQNAYNYGVEFPNDVKRMLNIASIPRQRLWGHKDEGIIDWDSPYTTLEKGLSSEWFADDGIIETIFNYILTKNLLS